MADNGVVSGGRLTDWVSLGVLASFVPRDAVDDAVAGAGKQARRSDGKLPPHVMVYFVMALALFADDDYEEVAARLTETLTGWGCWDDSWSAPTSGGITQARQRLGYEPVRELFSEVAAPVAEELTAAAFLGPWRLMAIDGFEWDAPDTKENAAAFGFSGAGADDADRPAYPKVRVVTVSECASHAVVDAAMGAVAGKGAGEQSLARKLYRRLEDDWLLIADRNFFNWADWCAAADSGAQLLWRGIAAPPPPLPRPPPPPGPAGGAGLPSKVGARDGERPAQDAPARPRAGPAVPEPGHGPPGDLRLPAHPLGHIRPDLQSRHRGRHRPRPGQVQAHRPHRPPPGRRPGGLSPLSTRNASWPPSWPASRRRRTSTRSGGTGPTPGGSNEPATTPTASSAPATTAPATRARPRSAWSTSPSSHSQPEKLNDQRRLSGIGSGRYGSNGLPAVRRMRS